MKSILVRLTFVIFVIVSVIYFNGPILSADPLSASEQDALNEWPAWVPDPSVCNSYAGELGSGPVFGLTYPAVSSNSALANSINVYIANTEPSSPLKGFGTQFVAAGQKYNVNPAMIIGFAEKESGLGTDTVNGSYDAFGLTAYGDIPGAPYSNGITYFSSWQASIDPEFNYVATGFIDNGATFYSTSIYELMTHYTPDDPGTQTAITLDVMHKILDGLQYSTSGPVDSGVGASSTDCSPDSGQSTSYTAGQDGFNLTGSNAMAQFYQCNNLDGSYPAPWANTNYGQAGTVCVGGCGITSMTMVVDTLTGANENPGTMATKYSSYGGPDGTKWSLWSQVAQDFNLNYTDLGTNFDSAASIIHQGGLVIVSVGPGYFTDGGHLMVIRAVDDLGNFYLADPNGPRPSNHPTETIGFSSKFMLTEGNTIQLFGFTKGS